MANTNLAQKIKGLFVGNPSATASIPTDDRQGDETYEHWGIRMGGKTGCNNNALSPCLQKAHLTLKTEQSNNQDLQEQMKAQTRAEIEKKEGSIAALEGKIKNCNNNIENLKGKIEELQKEKEAIAASEGTINKNQRLQLIIGLIIIVPLTIYLFMFYSSTIYSAFFRDPETVDSVANAMFDSNALSSAYKGGVTGFLFVLLAPIIFMALGFILHNFSANKERLKYAAILLVTFAFDCVLAYKIGDQLHEYKKLFDPTVTGDYSVIKGLTDVNTYAVIFCGFIAYFIWGLVFDIIMTAYDKLDLKKVQTASLTRQIADCEASINKENANINGFNGQINGIKKEKSDLQYKLTKTSILDYNIILRELANFFTGWMTQMTILMPGNDSAQKEANDIYDKFCNAVKNQTA
ncbi:MAG: hypothetical protein LUD72_10540 [Bacteroidales bacterium]|nr:hypothetical protein [Bacteroidales bacterium]